LGVVCSGFFDSIGLYRHADGGQIAIARRWLARMGMGMLGASPFNRLSQGQRQMILIARAMVKAPRLLILDEPCSGLDAHNRRRILDLLSDIGRGAETGLIVISHFEQDLPACTTHRLVLDHGTVVACGPLADRSLRDDASRHG
ncbi:MAG: ATP-binding cassette domain-containing protein, partial [Desulfosarcina sp.]